MSEEYKGFKLTINRDEYAESPRGWDNLGTMVHWHRRYDLGDGNLDLLDAALAEHPMWHDCYGDSRSEKYVEPDDAQRLYNLAIRFGFAILPYYLYDHSGLTVSTAPFSCPWDSGMVGFIFCSPAKMRENYNLKQGQRITAKRKNLVERILKEEIEIFDQFLRGDVWHYLIEDSDGESVESLGGVFGQEECKCEARRVVDEETNRTPQQLELPLHLPAEPQ